MEMIAAPPPSLPVPLLEVPLRAQLLAHVPEIVTSVLIPDGQASKEGFLEFCYKDILEALKPRTTAATEVCVPLFNTQSWSALVNLSFVGNYCPSAGPTAADRRGRPAEQI